MELFYPQIHSSPPPTAVFWSFTAPSRVLQVDWWPKSEQDFAISGTVTLVNHPLTRHWLPMNQAASSITVLLLFAPLL
jgi:hypothetical protein